MGAKQSKEMQTAQKLIEGGMSVTKAAAKAGISRPAIYMSAWWKARGENAKPRL